ncbi:hypothetical protein GDO78_012233 [Eleutherodactylus coqui]|uniref:Uncharacterized protein n=1 Tax=Eleutherodactylus coqui TaxID=57060 RepID=A0A8J6F557_ELECQ|nr:hypothetical protein GDO78_012233 [Eleutherodactylus coqui]
MLIGKAFSLLVHVTSDHVSAFSQSVAHKRAPCKFTLNRHISFFTVLTAVFIERLNCFCVHALNKAIHPFKVDVRSLEFFAP